MAILDAKFSAAPVAILATAGRYRSQNSRKIAAAPQAKMAE
jgi:hypothetical protein